MLKDIPMDDNSASEFHVQTEFKINVHRPQFPIEIKKFTLYHFDIKD
jgi:hypothetical protein